MFRLASILQGVYARGLQGNAASTYALQRGAAARLIAERAWEIARRAIVSRTSVRPFLSSSFAIVSRCTSSGPSASRNVRAMRPRVGEERVLADAGGAVRLDRAIEHPQRDVRRHDLDHRDRRRAPPCCRPCPSSAPHSSSAAAPDRSRCATARCRGESCLARRASCRTRRARRRVAHIVSSARSATPIRRMQ